ncbi:FlhC family transcriptional regulator [Azonexus hydrophilus]|uniref:FlhC family transcriptional regulator n=1 Tax=Azonexus hydrophilus TaxID=418702 RepID=A0ABZ2XLL8_9RHOO
MTTIESAASKLEAVYSEVLREIRLEAALIEFCARGARNPTLVSLFKKHSQSRVREFNRVFHGEDYQSKKPWSLDYFVGSADRRAQSATCVVMYRRLVDAGIDKIEAYLQLHRSHTQQYGPLAYNIDDMIRIIRASEDRGELRVEQCECGHRTLIKSDSIMSKGLCPMCTPHRGSKAAVRKAGGLTIASEEVIGVYIEKYVSDKTRVLRMSMQGARVKEIAVRIPGSEKFAAELYRRLYGRSSPQGGGVCNSEFHVETIDRRHQTSVIIKKYLSLIESGVREIEAVEATNAFYLATFNGQSGSDLMGYSRLAFAIVLFKIGELQFCKCGKCGIEYIVLKDEIPGDQQCPVCRMLAGKTVRPEKDIAIEYDVTESGTIFPPLPGDPRRRREERRQKQVF